MSAASPPEVAPAAATIERLAGLLACPDCRTPLEIGPAGLPPCPGCGRAFHWSGSVPLLTPGRPAETLAAGEKFFIDDPGRMTQLRRKNPFLARLVDLPDYSSGGVRALPECGRWFHAHVETAVPGERILNLGSGVNKVYDNPGLINFDIAPHENTQVAGDGEQLPFRDQVFDGVVLDAVIEHLAHPHRVIAEVRRVLKPGGVVLAHVPFLYPFHAAPHDYQRYTPMGLRMLFEEFEVLEAGSDRRPGRAVLEVMTAYAAGFSDNRAISYALRWLTAWAWQPVKWLDRWLSRKARADYVTASSSILARKRA